MDVAAFLLAGQNLTHSSAPNLLVYVVASHDGLHGIRSVVPAAAHLRIRLTFWLRAHAWISLAQPIIRVAIRSGNRQSAKVLFAKCSTLTNSRKFSPAKVSGYTVPQHQSLDVPASYTFLDTGTTQSMVNTDHPATDTSQQVLVLGFTDLITTDKKGGGVSSTASLSTTQPT